MQDVNYKHNHTWCKGTKFIKWGLGWFIFGLIFGFGVLIHYLAGSRWNNTDAFLSNITLWFGSPLSLSVAYLQLAGLGLLGLGAAYLAIARCCDPTCSTTTTSTTSTSCCTSKGCCPCPAHKCGSLLVCNIGLIALFITGYIGYFIIDMIWGGFYYTPIPAGKNLWLILQGLSILIFLLGFIGASCCFCKCKKETLVYKDKI